MSSSIHENNITTHISGYLRNRGIDIEAFKGVTPPGKRPVEPDFTVKNGGVFFGEAKWEGDYYKAIAEARDYGLIPSNGTFAIGYPEELKQKRTGDTTDSEWLSKHRYPVAFLRRDQETEMARLSLEELPDWLDDHFHQRVEPETDPDEAIAVLRQTASALTREIEEVDVPDLFQNIIGIEPEEDERAKAAKRAAGYLFANQISFYRVLSSVKDYPEINPDELDRPEELNAYFQRVLLDDYTAVFRYPVASAYSEEHLPLLKTAVKSIYGLAPERIDHDVLGTVFHELTPLSVRKQIAAYYTKNKAAKLLADLAIDDPDATVLDLACGSGTLLTAAYQRKKELSNSFREADHQRFLASDITGADIMPFAAHLSTIHLALQAPAYETERVRIGIEDSTALEPGSTITSLSRVLPESLQGQWEIDTFPDTYEPDWLDDQKIERGATTLKGEDRQSFVLDTVDVVLMNPPYTRQESIAGFNDEYKATLKQRFKHRRELLHGKMNYSSYFLFLADKFLDDGGKLAAVLPASVLNKKSDRGVRKMLLDEYNIQYIAARSDTSNFSEDTEFREILLVAEKGQSNETGTAYLSVDGLDVDVSNLSAVAATY